MFALVNYSESCEKFSQKNLLNEKLHWKKLIFAWLDLTTNLFL